MRQGRRKRTVGTGPNAGVVCEFALAARSSAAVTSEGTSAVTSASEYAGDGRLVWLMNTAGLCWQDSMPAAELDSIMRR